MLNKLIILDRDGVINKESPQYIKSPEEWEPIPGSLEAIAALNQAGYWIGVATNQSGIARGYYTQETLSAIHNKMQAALKAKQGHIHAIYFCPHKPGDGCACRKPQPGMLVTIMQKLGVSPTNTIMIGDSLSDILAAIAAQCQPIVVKTGHGKRTLANPNCPKSVLCFDHLCQAVEYLLNTAGFQWESPLRAY